MFLVLYITLIMSQVICIEIYSKTTPTLKGRAQLRSEASYFILINLFVEIFLICKYNFAMQESSICEPVIILFELSTHGNKGYHNHKNSSSSRSGVSNAPITQSISLVVIRVCHISTTSVPRNFGYNTQTHERYQLVRSQK